MPSPDAWGSLHAIPDRGGVGRKTRTLVHIEVPPPYTAAPSKPLSLACGALLRNPARRIVSPQHEECSMKRRERLTFEMEPEIKTTLEAWAREEDRSIGSLLRRIVEKAA